MSTTQAPPALIRRCDAMPASSPGSLASSLSRVGDVAWFVGLAWTAAQVAGPDRGRPGHGRRVGSAGRDPAASAAPTPTGWTPGAPWSSRTSPGSRSCSLAVLVIEARESSLALLLVVAVVFGLVDGDVRPGLRHHAPPAGARRRPAGRLLDVPARQPDRHARGCSARRRSWSPPAVCPTSCSSTPSSFAVIAVVLAVADSAALPAASASQGHSVRRDLADGFRYLRRAPSARTLTIALCGLNLFVGPITAVGVVLRTRSEDWGAPSLGLFEACIGAAAAVGAIVAMRWRPEGPRADRTADPGRPGRSLCRSRVPARTPASSAAC